MSLIRNSLYVVTLLLGLSLFNQAYASCQTHDLSFAVTVESMLAQAANIRTTATAGVASTGLLSSCSDLDRLSIQYQMGLTADLSHESIDIAGRRFYKIQSIQGQALGAEALSYLTQHAYVSFSIQASDRTIAVNTSQDSPIDLVQFDATRNISQQPSVILGLSNIELYFDALPTNDTIVNQLSSQPITLQVGRFNTQLKEKDQSESGVVSMTSALLMNIEKIEFKRATCFVQEQNITLDPVVVTAIKAGEATGNAKAFDVDLQCTGFLNQRNLHITWQDNNDRENKNSQGYLSSVKGASFSNVGIQVTDEADKPIQIGDQYIFQNSFSGLQMKKVYHARYYLPDGQPTVGIVNAQATLQILYP